MRRRLAIVLVSAAIIVATILVPSALRYGEGAQTVRCCANLMEIHRAIAAYRSAQGHVSPDLATLVRSSYLSEGLLDCPAAGGRYLYLSFEVPVEGVPLVFDRQCLHRPQGGCVLFADGRTERVKAEEHERLLGRAMYELSHAAMTQPGSK